MRHWGKVEIGLLAVVAMFALPAGTAAAATPITVNSETDAPLESAASMCESTDPGKDCTLLAAVELADEVSEENSGETVTVDVPAGKYENTLGSSGVLRVDNGESVVIDGAGPGKTIIDGGGADQSAIDLEEGASLRLHGVTVQRGNEDEGGGIYAHGSDGLIVENSAVENNKANDDGGGIYAGDFSYVAIINSTIAHNAAGRRGAGVDAEFGSAVEVSGSTIEENAIEDEGEGGGIYVELIGEHACELAKGAAKAGAKADLTILEEESAELVVQQSTIDRNTATWGGGIYAWQDNFECADAKHAAAHVAGAAVRPGLVGFNGEEPENMLIDKSTIAYNRAEEGEEDGGFGGGIYEEGPYEDPIINSTIAYNFATNDGGGLYLYGGASDFLISDTVFDNTVTPLPEIQAKQSGSGGAPKGDVARPATVEDTGQGYNIATETDDEAEVHLRNTIVAESGGQQNCRGEIHTLGEGKGGYNLDYPSTPVFDEPYDTCGLEEGEHDQLGVNPQLEEELKNNGGPAQTLALKSSSPAIGYVPLVGDCNEPESGFGPANLNEKGETEKPVDERGAKRPGLPGRECDIGAYEYQEPAKAPATTTTKEEPKKAAAAGAASVLPFKVVVQCTSKRDITIHLQNVKQFGIVSAVVSIDGHHKRTLTGRRLTTAINLVGLPKGTFTIEIVAHTRSGHTLHGKRVYHTCHTKLPGHSYIRL